MRDVAAGVKDPRLSAAAGGCYLLLADMILVGAAMPFGNPPRKIVKAVLAAIAVAEVVRHAIALMSHPRGCHGIADVFGVKLDQVFRWRNERADIARRCQMFGHALQLEHSILCKLVDCDCTSSGPTQFSKKNGVNESLRICAIGSSFVRADGLARPQVWCLRRRNRGIRLMQAWSQPSGHTRTVLGLLLIAALGFGIWQYHRAALAAFDRAAQAQARPWLQPARARINLTEWLRLPWLDSGDIARLLGPKAIDRLAEDPLTITSLDGARHAVRIFNRIRLGCSIVAPRQHVPACSGTEEAARLRRIDDNLEQSAAGGDHYVTLSGQWLSISPKIAFSSAVCNLYPAQASFELDIRYHPTDRLSDQRISRQLAPGECATPFARKLRHAPTIHGDARATAYRDSGSGQARLEWSRQLAVADQSPNPVWGLADPALCHSAPGANCGGRHIGNPLGYARALAASLHNEAEFARFPPDALFRFMIGAYISAPTARDQFGVIITSVMPGSPAEAAGLRPGDRIVSIGETVAFTNADVILTVDRHGATRGHDTPLAVEVVRDGAVLRGALVLAFNRAYWDARGFSRLTAFFTGFIDSATLGLAKDFYCGVVRPMFGLRNPDGLPETHRECVRRWIIEGQAAAMLYRSGYRWGSFAGSMISPLNLVLPRHGFVLGVIRNEAARQLVRGAVVAVIEDSVTTFALAGPGESTGDLMRRLQRSLPRTVLVGAATSRLPSL